MSLRLEVVNENLRLKAPFRISGYTFHESPVTVVTLRDDAGEGRGEGSGVYYLDDVPEKCSPRLRPIARQSRLA